MACSCCGPPALAQPTASQPERRADPASNDGSRLNDEACADQVKAGSGASEQKATQEDCCSSGRDASRDEGHRVDPETPSCRQDGCCETDTHMDAEAKPSYDGISASSAAACAVGCCSASPPKGLTTKDLTTKEEPGCCRGKPSPCCDDSCLDRLALRECDTGATASCSDQAEDSPCCQPSSAGTKRTACDRHRRSTRERYGGTLEALGCICRALLALGQESCCETQKPLSVERKSFSRKSSHCSSSRLSKDSCCASGIALTKLPIGSRARPRKPSSLCSDHGPSGACGFGGPGCNTAKAVNVRDDCADACCASWKRSSMINTSAVTQEDDDDGSCCNSPKPNTITAKLTNTGPKANDAENQALGVEHVALCISGMTCTGCETKLNRTLATVSGVKNLKTSLVLSRAEFDVDLRLITVDHVMKHLERTTEFKCERMTNHGSTMDILLPGDASIFVNQVWPGGVIDMCLVDKNIVRVSFNPKIVGARDLLVTHFGRDARLAPVQGDPSIETGNKHVRHVGYMTALSAVFTIPVLVMAWAPLPERQIAYSSASLALATVVQVFVAGPFYPKALKALVFSKVIEMDLLIVLSTSAAFIFSVISFGYFVAGKRLSTGQFFETSTLLVTLIMVGRYVAALARQKAVESISIRSLQAQTALLVDDGNVLGEREIDARLLQHGDCFKVLPDTKIPTDGTVVEGTSEVDESLLTGESRPVEKHAKSQVIAGTVNGYGTLVVRLTGLPGDNTITAIAAMVDEAKLSKPKMQELADRVASYFVPVVVALTVMTFIIWVSVGVAVRGKTGSEAAVQALTYAITVLIVSCPCAIGLAVPMVVVIASGVAAERGVIFKSADAMEVAYRASHVVFDKTGTLTQGELAVAVEHCLTDRHSSLSLLLGLIADSRHPVSVAVADHLRGKEIVASVVPGAKSLTGLGLEAKTAGQTLRAGSSRWLGLSWHPTVQEVLAQGHTAFCFAMDGELVAVYGLKDSIRIDAAYTVTALQTRGVSVHVVSGDDEGAVRRVAAELGIHEDNTRARSSPADKQAYVQSLLGDTKKPVVVFCGDGTNDAVALAQATIGVHMNQGSDVAQSAADVVLMRPDLCGILTMMSVSRRAVSRIKFNFAWSFVYNTLAVLIAAGAFVHARIPPQFAGLGELVSVLPVIAAAVLLRWSSI